MKLLHFLVNSKRATDFFLRFPVDLTARGWPEGALPLLDDTNGTVDAQGQPEEGDEGMVLGDLPEAR